MIDIEKLTALAIAYDAGDAKRIQHFIKVYAYSRLLGRREGLDEHTQNVLEAAAVLHDIGIHEAERKHGSSGGHWQEMEGPAVAAPMLRQCGADERESERVQWLIAHHHTYTAGEEKDFRILLEADFLVNAYEDGMTAEQCKTAKDRVFRTETGKQYLEEMFLKPNISGENNGKWRMNQMVFHSPFFHFMVQIREKRRGEGIPALRIMICK